MVIEQIWSEMSIVEILAAGLFSSTGVSLVPGLRVVEDWWVSGSAAQA